MAARRYVQTGGKCVHNLVFILAQICTILHIWTSIDNYAFLDRSFQPILGWITWLIHWLTERIFLRSINKQEYSQQQVSSYWSDAFTSFFSHWLEIAFVWFFFSQYFSVLEIDQIHWSLECWCHRCRCRWSPFVNALVFSFYGCIVCFKLSNAFFFSYCCIVCFKCQWVGRQFCSGDDGRPGTQSDLKR